MPVVLCKEKWNESTAPRRLPVTDWRFTSSLGPVPSCLITTRGDHCNVQFNFIILLESCTDNISFISQIRSLNKMVFLGHWGRLLWNIQWIFFIFLRGYGKGILWKRNPYKVLISWSFSSSCLFSVNLKGIWWVAVYYGDEIHMLKL